MDIATLVKNKRADILKIADKYGASNVRVFGSVVKGKTANDLDLLISFDVGRSLLDLIAFKQDLEDFLGCKVDVVTERSLNPYIRDEVFKEAVNL
ncbi:nucleotidyltransferase family protein [bacterium]|nr:nucleotidyltransferase family protein [bacterium]